jgi:flagellar motility protein MotE (MotC chaperone)
MKNIILLLVMILFCKTYAADSADKKIYSKTEFKEKVQKMVDKKVDAQIKRIKKSSVADLTREILEREKELEKKEGMLQKKVEQLKRGEESLAKKIFDVENQQKKIIGCIENNKTGQARRVKQLVSMISNMKPVKAADVLSVQDSLISVKILEQIDPKRASRIFNLMDKEVSARLQKQYLNMQK